MMKLLMNLRKTVHSFKYTSSAILCFPIRRISALLVILFMVIAHQDGNTRNARSQVTDFPLKRMSDSVACSAAKD